MGLWLARRAEPSTSQPIWETVGFTAPRVDRPEWQKFLAALPRWTTREVMCTTRE
ncbi:hypothetical protein T484DRAFT_1849621 [Baffinella frigidus]|nr:hypothetical protein T484DRAFT_1849621 [Cryptophyta sp. CCMP2293]